MKRNFRAFATRVSDWAGSPLVFVVALLVIALWAVSGPASNYSDTWQLVINTGTTIVTFLMVFLIQNTQNRDSHAMHLKLDELIRSHKTARDSFVSLEDISDEELILITQEFRELREHSVTSKSMHKLHQKIEAEHNKRLSLPTMGEQVVGVIFNPLGQKHKKD